MRIHLPSISCIPSFHIAPGTLLKNISTSLGQKVSRTFHRLFSPETPFVPPPLPFDPFLCLDRFSRPHIASLLNVKDQAAFAQCSHPCNQAVIDARASLINELREKTGLDLFNRFFGPTSQDDFSAFYKRTQNLLAYTPEDLRPSFSDIDQVLNNPTEFERLLKTHMALSRISVAEALGGPTRVIGGNLEEPEKAAIDRIGASTDRIELALFNRALTILPPEFENLSNLQALELEHNQLQALPPELGTLSKLQVLSLHNNQLQALPPELANLSNLQMLFLYNNQLQALPPELGNLSSLKYLHLDNNQLQALPSKLGNLSNLQLLYLNHNQLQALPPEVGNLSNLQDLYLHNNQLQALPPELGNLSKLQTLRLEDTQLQALPPEFGNLSNLDTLWLNNNQLQANSPLISALRARGVRIILLN